MADSNLLTYSRLREVLNYEPETGVFVWLVRPGASSHVHVGDAAGTISGRGYVSIGIDGKYYTAHRLAWLYMKGSFPPFDVDHINQNRADNRACNLRQATESENAQNRRGPNRNNKSGALGVSWDQREQKWIAKLVLSGNCMHRSRHKTYEAACFARRTAEEKFHPFSTSRVAA